MTAHFDRLAELAIKHQLEGSECETLLIWLERFEATERKASAITAIREFVLYTFANDPGVNLDELTEDPEALVRFREP